MRTRLLVASEANTQLVWQIPTSQAQLLLQTTLLPLLLSLVVCVAASFTFPTRLVLQSPGGLFLENLASSTLHMVDPTGPTPTFDEVHTFPNVTALLGIAEVKPDVYGIIALVLNDTTITAIPGTVTIWRVDLSSGGPPMVNKAADVPDGMFLDGLSAVPGEPELVLGADTAAGRIWQINLRTGVVRIAAQDDAFAPDAPAPAFGINGLHVRGGNLYFTNSQKKTFSRFPISLRGGNVAQAGPIEVLRSANGTDQFDDFAFDSAGRVWAATLPDTLTVFFPPVRGNSMLGQLNALGNPVEFNRPTSAMFGRGGVAQQHTLYVTTQAGQLIAVDTTGIRG
ncbi:hypothetical protein B0H16DRAFT_1790265 [Mycena metata]|uniref:SMP-30/Gluconolactonase/LRE-like region domain-containing protein n=1 Tax=Mycena metata TaxID=1033252 RepID=A0AAD7HIX4_9AGAR|nr:hypothetical protein B0H16DRAFT_1790265 [Mycena metata]